MKVRLHIVAYVVGFVKRNKHYLESALRLVVFLAMRAHNNYHAFENVTPLCDAFGRRYLMSVSENWCSDKKNQFIYGVPRLQRL